MGNHGHTNGEDDGRLPAFEDPNLPDRFKENYFGTPNVYDGYVYESESEYLNRLKLLKRAERRALQDAEKKAVGVPVRNPRNCL